MSAPPPADAAELLVTRLAEVATPRGNAARAGAEQGRIERIPDGEVLIRDGRIAFVGPRAERERRFGALESTPRLDGGGGVAVPGFVDAHTHLPWAGDRAAEFLERLGGRSYAEIAEAGGGILSTVRATRAASGEAIVAAMRQRLDWMLACGTTTAEAKSGYGLSLDAETKQLEAIRAAGASHPIELVPTLLAAHETPEEHRGDAGGRTRWLDQICAEIVPAVAERGLARYCDVFCERGVFSAAESRRVLEAGIRHGLAPRLHADEFADSGGAELAAELGARSADHLVHVSAAGMRALAQAPCAATLLPAASFYLRLPRYAPARALVEAGAPIALATDANPGGGLSPSMPFAMTVACFGMGLSFEEALAAATVNAAWSLGVHHDCGSVEVGKRADLVVLRSPRLLDLLRVGVPAIRAVVKDGRVAVRDGRMLA